MPETTAIHFVNHASYILRHGEVRLLVDPWTSGDAFHHGWSLLAPTTTPPEVLADVTHIWISHEHPDHFAPSFFRTIPKEKRGQITALYQKTKDRKVVDYLAKAGFQVVELTSGAWTRIADDLEVLNVAVPIGDSYLVTRSKGVTTVNMNDCTHVSGADLRRIREQAGKVDVLFTQFGYASWQGAPEDTALRKELAKAQLDRITVQVEALVPRFAIPFASFVYFSASENAYLNDANNKVIDAYGHLRSLGVRPVVLFPGDEWTVGEEHDSRPALARWQERETLPKERYTGVAVPLAVLEELAADYRKRMLEFHSPRMVRALHATRMGFFGPIDIYVTDLEQSLRFDIFGGLTRSERSKSECAAAMHSETFGFLLQFDYGLNTLSVNGRFTSDTKGWKRVVRAFGLGSLKNEGRRFAPDLLTDKTIWKSAKAAFFQRTS